MVSVDFGAVGVDDDHGVHAVAADEELAAIGGETEMARCERQRQADHGLPGGDIEDGDVRSGRLPAINVCRPAGTDDGRLGAGRDGALDGGAWRGTR